MALRERLREWRLPLPPPSQVPVEPPLFAKAKKEIEARLQVQQPRQPTKEDLDLIFKLLRDQYRAWKSLDEIPGRYLRRAPWVIFTHPGTTPGELGQDPAFAKDYLAWAGRQRTASAVALLFFAFLKEYPVAFPTFDVWRNGIARVLQNAQSARLGLARKRCDEYHLLAKNGPQRFSELLAAGQGKPSALIEDAGLTGQLGNQGFFLAAYRHLLTDLALALRSGKAQTDVLDRTLRVSVTSDGKGLRFPAMVKALAESLLLPFAEGGASQTHRKRIQDFLLQHLGDPRIVRTGWIAVDERALRVMYSWLVEAHLEDFFNILSQTADAIWRYRRHFWGAYLRKGVIQEAWVVLGRQARSIAREHFGSKNLYGDLWGASPNQSVLLMRIGGLIIAEWSHNGSCRIWMEDGEKTPKFYRPKYQAWDLRWSPDYTIRHVNSWGGSWQEKVASILRAHTNIKIFRVEYMPGSS